MMNFEKVGECLYRYTPTGTYYARFQHGKTAKGKPKEIRRSLKTTDRALAKRRLADLQQDVTRMDLAADKATLGEMCDRYLATIKSQKAKTVTSKTDIAAKLKRDFPGGVNVPVGKVIRSRVSAWLASYSFGAASHNKYLMFIRAVFEMAVADRILASSPVDGLKMKRPAKPIRLTPSYEEFVAIVADVRANDINADAGDRADYLEFMGRAGLGTAEVAALRWVDVNWQAEQITTFRVKTSAGFVVPLFPQIRPLLERLKNARGRSPATTEKVFQVQEARQALENACRRLGLPAYTHRSLRRQFIVRCLEMGVDVKTVSSWQGHRDGGALILSVYSHVRPVHSRAMAALMV